MAIGNGNGTPLEKEHGGVRMVFPTLFGWKSAKFLTQIIFEQHSRSEGFYGFWEKNGCHNRGRVAFNERWDKNAENDWNRKIAILNFYKNFLGTETWLKIMQIGGNAQGKWVQLKKKIFG